MGKKQFLFLILPALFVFFRIGWTENAEAPKKLVTIIGEDSTIPQSGRQTPLPASISEQTTTMKKETLENRVQPPNANLSESETQEDEDPLAKEKEACIAKKGKWGFYGDVQIESCSLPTQDKGKFCSDNDECEGDCIVNLDSTLESELKRGRKIAMKGRCSDMSLNRSCQAFAIKGFVVMGECSLKQNFKS